MKSIYYIIIYAIFINGILSAQSPGYGLRFNGTSDYATANLNTGTSSSIITYETWFLPVTIQSGGRFLADLHTMSGSQRKRLLPYLSDGVIWIFCNQNSNVDDTDNWINQSSGFSVSQNTWYHLAVVVNGTNLKLYINGNLSLNINKSVSYSTDGNEVLYLAQDYWGGGLANIKLDEIRVWNTARTETEIDDNMNSELSGNEEGLVAYYKMNTGNGITLSDDKTSGTLYNGSINGASWVSGFLSPGIQASNINSSDITGSSSTISWTRGSGSNIAVFIKQASSGSAIPSNTVSYTANNVFGSGNQIDASGWYCIYNGTGTTVNVTGLSESSTYQIHAVEYDAGPIYNFDDGVNNPASLTSALPVELTSFTANLNDGRVILNWQTATEITNYGFDVERLAKSLEDNWELIGFVPGHGNSNSPKEYSFVDENPPTGELKYRLKQIDTDGQYEYYGTIAEVNFSLTNVGESIPAGEGNNLPTEFSLSQNYPNPFNPTTKIKYSILQAGYITLKVYNILGTLVREIVNEYKQPGNYEVEFSASDGNAAALSSGVYFYQLESGSFTEVKKLVLTK